MLFPGCRIKVIESNVKGTTGPIPGSVGFVSEYRPHFNLIELNRVVWLRYGKNGKQRMETGNFAVIVNPNAAQPKLGRRSGTVEIVRRGSIQKMDYMEFLCWAFSILRLKKSEWEHKEMKKLLYEQFEMKLHKYAPVQPGNLINNQYINSIAGREAMAGVCRQMRGIYYKSQLRRIRHDVDHLGIILKKDVNRQEKEYTPKSYAKAVQECLIGAGTVHRYIAFFNRFNHDAFLYPKAEHLCRGNKWLLEIVKQYKKVNGSK